MKKVKAKKLEKLIKSIDSFFDQQTTRPSPREYSNFIAEIQNDLKKLVQKKQ